MLSVIVHHLIGTHGVSNVISNKASSILSVILESEELIVL